MNVLFHFLPALTAAISAIAACMSMVQLRRRYVAEAHMRELVKMSQRLQDLKFRVTAAHDNGEIDAEFFAEVSETLEQLAEQLREHERQLVLRSLRQPSAIGRQRYVDNLLAA